MAWIFLKSEDVEKITKNQIISKSIANFTALIRAR